MAGLDAATKERYRTIMESHMPDTAVLYDVELVPGVSNPTDDRVSDGMGGFIYNEDAAAQGSDERVEQVSLPCRVTVPRANRSDSEYIEGKVNVTETRVVLVFPWDAPLQPSMKINVVTEGGELLELEVKIITPHSDAITLQCECVDLFDL